MRVDQAPKFLGLAQHSIKVVWYRIAVAFVFLFLLSSVSHASLVGSSRINQTFGVDKAFRQADIDAGVIVNGRYITNPTAQNLSDLVTSSGRIGGKNFNGQYMYVVDQNGGIVIGSRAGQRMPHPTLVGGENPQVLSAGIVDIRGGKIYSVNNSSGHFKPSVDSLKVVEERFRSLLPDTSFHRDFRGFTRFDE